MNKLFTVIKYEYLTIVKSSSFWISTLLLPLFSAVIMAISIISSTSVDQSDVTGKVLVIDNNGIIAEYINTLPTEVKEQFELREENIRGRDMWDNSLQDSGSQKGLLEERGLQDGSVKVDDYSSLLNNSDYVAVFVFPTDLLTDTVQIYGVGSGIIPPPFEKSAGTLVAAAAQSKIADPQIAQLSTGQVKTELTLFDESGESYELRIERFVVPVVSVVLFFMLVISNGQRLLQSVAEEKENRMIETILSIISARTLIYGKILGALLTSLSQLSVWVVSGVLLFIAGAQLSSNSFPIQLDLSMVSFEQIILGIIFSILGILCLGAIMVGVGALGSSYKESQGYSAFFTIFSVVPLYFLGLFFSDANGVIPRILSFIPFSSPLTILLRTGFTTVPTVEIITVLIVNILFTLVSFWLAVKMFKFGALLYKQGLTLKDITAILQS